MVNHPEKLAELKICQNEEIIKRAASTSVSQGEELAKDGDFEAAVDKFRKANKWDSQLDINPQEKAAIAFFTQGKELVGDDKVKEAIAAYKKALEINPKLKISAKNWDMLCWYGSLYEQAVALLSGIHPTLPLK